MWCVQISGFCKIQISKIYMLKIRILIDDGSQGQGP